MTVRRTRTLLSDPFFREFFGRDLPFRIPREERRTSLGSGVLVAGDGLIVTNNHVIDRAQQVIITTADHRRYRAKVLGSDAVTDIAVVKIEGSGPPTLAWGDSARADVGEYVVEVEGRAVENAAQLRNELARAEVGSELRVTVRREGRRRVLRIRVEETGSAGA